MHAQANIRPTTRDISSGGARFFEKWGEINGIIAGAFGECPALGMASMQQDAKASRTIKREESF